VFLSSHLLTEIANNADDAIIIDHGRLVSAGPIADLVPATAGTVVTTPDAELLAAALRCAGATVERTGIDRLTVTGVSAEVIGRAAVGAGAVVVGMRAEGADLEAIFANLIHPKELVS
jgi:ABC-2 type transport system ATP-binding protein